jgi:hypothetical protein
MLGVLNQKKEREMKDSLKRIFGLGGKTEAYQNRKKGRKQHSDRMADVKKLIACIQSRGEVTPADLAQALGMARSTLTYTLNWLLDNSPGVQETWKNSWNLRMVKYLLGPHRIERLGAGKYVRYRIVEVPQAESPVGDKTASPKMTGIYQQPNPSTTLGAGQVQEQEGPKWTNYEI